MSINLNNFEILTLKTNDVCWSLSSEEVQTKFDNQEISNLVVNEIDIDLYADQEELQEYLQDKTVCLIDDVYYTVEKAVNGDSVKHDGSGNYIKPTNN